jgi:hypothetical protein
LNTSIKALPLALSLLAAPAIAQQTVSEGGTGNVVLYPFYSTENNSNTYMHVVNTTAEQKAVKVRFLEAQGASVVLEFNVYLGAHDIFPVALASNDLGGTSVLTTDASCTVPELGTANAPYDGDQVVLDDAILRSQPFVPYQFENEESDGISRTLIGYAEAYEMGVVDDTVDVSDCAAVRALWNSGAWASDTSANVTGPTGGIGGSSLFINPDLAFSANVKSVTIQDWAVAGTNYHTGPGALAPDLTDGVKTAVVDGVTVDYTSKANGSVLATSALLASSSIYNEVQTEDVIAAETDWVLTFPTKRHLDGVAPFTKAYDGTEANGAACETLTMVRRDRNSNSSNGTGSFVPNTDGVDDKVCNTVQVLSFNSKSALVTDTNKDVAYSFQSGAATITADQALPADDNGVTVQGIPVIGFAATRIVNGAMSYGYSVEHKTSVVTSN